LRMAHFHTDMERFDVHVVLEVCEIVIGNANVAGDLWATRTLRTAKQLRKRAELLTSGIRRRERR
jgi:hypothetical protein